MKLPLFFLRTVPFVGMLFSLALVRAAEPASGNDAVTAPLVGRIKNPGTRVAAVGGDSGWRIGYQFAPARIGQSLACGQTVAAAS